MRNMKLLRALRSEERGFTLIELLLVILILGVLMGIAVFAVDPFSNRAIKACEDANAAIRDVEDAARAAGVEGDLFAREANCAVPSGGGNGGGAALATFVDEDFAATGTITTGATSGNLLVAFATHRSDPVGTQPAVTGWTARGMVQQAGSINDRRGIAVYTRIANDTAADNFAPDASFAGARGVLEFDIDGDANLLVYGAIAATPGDSTTGTSQALSAAAHPNSGPALAIAAMTTRMNAADNVHPSNFQWTGVTARGSSETTSGTTGTNLYAGSATTSSATHSASATWTGSPTHRGRETPSGAPRTTQRQPNTERDGVGTEMRLQGRADVGEAGFTLVELLVVILLLGILASIAIFGADVFQGRARNACSNVNARMEQAVEDAINLGATGNFYEVEPGDCEALGGLGDHEISARSSVPVRLLPVVRDHGASL